VLAIDGVGRIERRESLNATHGLEGDLLKCGCGGRRESRLTAASDVAGRGEKRRRQQDTENGEAPDARVKASTLSTRAGFRPAQPAFPKRHIPEGALAIKN
jgi:hypothetical protein